MTIGVAVGDGVKVGLGTGVDDGGITGGSSEELELSSLVLPSEAGGVDVAGKGGSCLVKLNPSK